MIASLLPAGYRLIELDEIDSTNAQCLRMAERGERGPLWIMAARQSAARGSRGRSWYSGEGNLLASLLLEADWPIRSGPQLAYAAALAVRDTIAQLAHEEGASAEPRLKWPNDILLKGRKLCGILLEGHSVSGRQIAIAGIGLNCREHPANACWPATSLAAEGIWAEPRQVLPMLARHFDKWLAIWDRGSNFAKLREIWLANAAGLGENIALRMGEREVTGQFAGIDEQGLLVLERGEGSSMRISAAEIFQMREAGSGGS